MGQRSRSLKKIISSHYLTHYHTSKYLAPGLAYCHKNFWVVVSYLCYKIFNQNTCICHTVFWLTIFMPPLLFVEVIMFYPYPSTHTSYIWFQLNNLSIPKENHFKFIHKIWDRAWFLELTNFTIGIDLLKNTDFSCFRSIT